MPGKKMNNKKNGRAHDLWTERKREFNSTPERKLAQREYRQNALAGSLHIIKGDEVLRVFGEEPNVEVN